MHNLLRAYRGLFRANVAIAFTYRAQAVIWMLSFVFPLVMLAVWLAVVDQAGPVGGYNRGDFISYYLVGAVLYRFVLMGLTYHWDHEIRTGELSVRLLKPLDPFHYYLSEQLGWKVLDLLILVPLALVAALLIPGVHYALSPARLLAFVFSVVLGMTINVCISSAFGMIAFWTTQSRNLFELWSGIGQFLSGFIAPLPLFPLFMQRVAAVLPFRNSVGLPVDILMGRVGWAATGQGLLVGALWALGACMIYRVLWRLGLRRYEAVGA
ncbi:MAG: ABC-2 family transporter protein [Herpetosiphonaceae bacterium]|nr:ABC-2 family transporter protein [Herpetosiphonaceae bacterium]